MEKLWLSLGRSRLVRLTARRLWMPFGSLRFNSAYRQARKKGDVRLHVGCGRVRLAGWLNTDIAPRSVYLDVSRKLPVQSESIDYVFGEHFINYLPRNLVLAFLQECYRALKPGGVLRITTVNVAAVARAYLDDPQSARLFNERNRSHGYRFHTYPIDILNKTFFEDGNLCEYDDQTLRILFTDAGFGNVVSCKVGASSHPPLVGIEKHESGTLFDNFLCAIEGIKENSA